MAKTKEKKKLIEKVEFNDYAYAADVKTKAEKNLERIKVGLIISAVATLLSVIGIALDNKATGILLFFALIGSIVSYIIGGGFLVALKAAGKLAKFGWFVCPVFPADLFVGLITLIVAIAAFFFVPVIFVFINYRQNKSDYDLAQEFLQYCKVEEKAEETAE